jgi:hypothetical protein
MARKNTATALLNNITAPVDEPAESRLVEHTMTDELRGVVSEIDQIFGDVQVASLTAFWRVGKLITDVKNAPDTYLTPEQRAAHVDGASLIISIFAPVYTAEQLRSAVMFYDRYPSEADITRLLTLRNPERPRWRLTVSHVQLLAQVEDEDQRQTLEEKCAEEAITARNLSLELQEMRGKQKNSGRTHQAPKGLKQQLLDLLQHQRRFIGRSEKLWLNEKEDNIYDDIANASPVRIDTTIRSYFAEIRENFDRMSDMVADHLAMCRKVGEEVIDRIDADDEEAADEEDDSVGVRSKKRSDITR